MISNPIKAFRGADLGSSELRTWSTAHSRWYAGIVPSLKPIHGSGNENSPSLLSNSDLCQRLGALGMLARIGSLFTTKFRTFNSEEILSLANVFSELIECFEKLQVGYALIGRDIDAILFHGQRRNSSRVYITSFVQKPRYEQHARKALTLTGALKSNRASLALKSSGASCLGGSTE
jgi:hypothetical protein